MNIDDQVREITRGTIDVISTDELKSKLSENRPLNIKFGIDPTAPDIHLGHTVPLQKLKQFQDMGHVIHLIIGDYTAQIGDPSGKSETRPMLTPDQIQANLATYTDQVFKILDPDRTDLLFNSQWLDQFSGRDMIDLGSRYTVQQLLQRRDFGNRIKEGRPLSVTELLYPLLVGYDSVHLHSDIELGGSDQLFNFTASRALQSAYGQKPEVIMILPILEGLDGVQKMSKSLGNAIGVRENPDDMYGKIMSISDDLMIKYYELLSDVPVSQLDEIKTNVKAGKENPMVYKKGLARELVARYHGVQEAQQAEYRFEEVHQRRHNPDELESLQIPYSSESDLGLISIVRLSGRASTNSEARRLIQQSAVRINDEPITDINYRVTPEDGSVLRVGKRFFKELYFKHD